MTSVGTFNTMLEQFLNELEQTFPEEKSFKKYHTSFDIMRKANPKKCVETFMKFMTPYSNQVMAKDEAVFQNFPELEIGKYWTDDLSENTKAVIWQYLQTLNILGMTITNIPGDMLNMVENVASQLADNMGNGGENNLMSSMSGLLGNLGGLLGGNK